MAESTNKYFFKYKDFDFRHLFDVLVGSRLWFASPLTFNDPFDCRPFVDTSGTPKELEQWLMLRVKRMETHLSDELQVARVGEFLRNIELMGGAPAFFGDGRQPLDEIINNIGVLSLANSDKNVMLWSHYADNHRGVCLRFLRGVPPFKNARKVVYSNVRPRFRFLDSNRRRLAERALLHKATTWRDEEEWRAIEPGRVGVVDFDGAALDAVIFGDAASARVISSVLELVGLRPYPTALYQARLNRERFTLDLHQFG